jgi:hypothetical protein
MTTMKQLIARQESTRREFEAARDAAEAIANQENQALASDEALHVLDATEEAR